MNRSLNAHAHDILRCARRISRLEVVVTILAVVEGVQLALHLFVVGFDPILSLLGVKP
jgi:hypothetical protein